MTPAPASSPSHSPWPPSPPARTRPPFLPLTLSWSALQTGNPYGLGTGCTFGVTRYDESVNPGQLLLSSGERYRVNRTLSGDGLTLRQCPLPTFRLSKVKGDNGVMQCLIRHKDGHTEVLEKQTQSLWLPVRIVAPTGRHLALTWQAGQGVARLSTVEDENGLTLCRFTWGDVPAMTVWPGTDEEMRLMLYPKNGYLSEIHNVSDAAEKLVWTLGWEDSETLRFPGNVCPLKSVRTPAGLTHTVTWEKKMRFNARSGEGRLPAVVKSQVSTADGEVSQVATYRYSIDSRNPGDDETVLNHNWLGYGAAFSDSEYDTNNDNLLSLRQPYHYWSEVSLKGAGGDPDTVVRRTYNRFHLMTEERIWLEGRACVHTQAIQYYADESKTLAEQKAIWSFPHTVTQTWQQGSALRSETARSAYDEHTGNLLTQTAPDGTVITMTWYPASGEGDRCPADPHGFARCLKSRTVTPVRTAYGDEPVTREVHTWTDIAAKAAHRGQSGRPETVVMPHTVSTFVYLTAGTPEENTARSSMTYQYQQGDVTARDFGRLTRQVSTFHNEISPAHPYETETGLTFTYDGATHRQTRTVTVSAMKNAADPDFMAPVVTTSRVVSGLTGRVMSLTDATGNVVRCEYDALGRPKGQTLHPEDEAYRQASRTQYFPADSQGHTQVVHTDALKNQVRTTFNALGQVVRQEVQDMDGPEGKRQAWLTASACQYDARGQGVSTAVTDWLRADEASGETGEAGHPLPALQTPVSVSTTAPVRDDWGRVVSTRGSDGLTHHRVTDPVACTVTTWTTDAKGKETPRTVTYGDPRTGRVVRAAVFPTAEDLEKNAPYSTVTQAWDGVGRLRQSTDPLGHTTAFTYDVFGRVVSTTLPDGVIVHKRYAPSGAAGLAVSISVTDPVTKATTVQGVRRFDAAGRVVSSTVGKDEATGRTTTAVYEKSLLSRTHTDSTTGPDGVTCTVESDPRLGNAVLSVKAEDKHGVLPAVGQTFSYNRLTGQMLDAQAGSSVTRQYYRPSGAGLRREEQVYGGSVLRSHAVHSLAGRVQQVTGVEGAPCTYHYITRGRLAGRVASVTDNGVTVTPAYDDLNRVSGWTAVTLQGGQTLTTEMVPDAYGREHSRTITHSNGEVRVLTQRWTKSGQLEGRTWVRRQAGQAASKEETLCDETFIYDARSRLQDYRVTGTQLPRDAHGNAFVRQRFTFDALSNIRTCETTLDSRGHGAVITATYGYAGHDPCRLTSVTYNREASAQGYKDLAFSDADYDAAGRLLKDEAGRGLHYDALGRLVRVTQNGGQAGEYGYDAGNRLAWQRVDSTQQLHRLYYRGSRLVTEWVSPQGEGQKQDDKTDTLIRLTGVAQTTRQGGKAVTLLLGTDGKGSVLTGNDGHTRDYGYSPYGQGSRTEHGSERQGESVRGWNGERRDPVTGTTHLGNGYRAYNPVLMRFHCPDSLSPFGAGGINPYAYCAGDPVNHADPTGHLSWNGWLSIGLGIAAVVIGVATLGLGAAGAISLGVMAASMAVLDVASGALSIASGALEESDPEMSEKLGWASLGVGAPSMVYGGVKLVQGGINLGKGVAGLYHLTPGRLLLGAASAKVGSLNASVGSAMMLGLAGSAATVQGAKAGVTVASQTGDGVKGTEAGEGAYSAAQVNKLRTIRAVKGDTARRGHRLLSRSNAPRRITESANIGAEGTAYILGTGDTVGDYALALEADMHLSDTELFVVAHGEPGMVQISNDFMNAQEFANYLSEQVNNELSEYRRITLAICDSGTGGNSVGREVSRLAGNNTTVRAFMGNIVADQKEFTEHINEMNSVVQLIQQDPSLFDFKFHYYPEQLVTWH
ncbi:RHS repeat-associated core domain [Cedecea neteri]|uniref:RHS repeat-associated core domain n=1 Tax=Cedecea neteri TaxID=158822 RepID=A0A2X3KX68_9ENTR|nr:RHS repeat-associated core domain [Cedecea neteri]